MKILSADQIRQLDQYTIQHEPIASIDLMERASETFVQWFCERFYANDEEVVIFCGPGNNGGDGLAIARLLYQRSYRVRIVLCQIAKQRSPDCEANFQRLPGADVLPVEVLNKDQVLPDISVGNIVIDAIFGSGLNRPVEGYWGELLDRLNELEVVRVAVDIPSGLFADQSSRGSCFQAHYTLSFQLPKLAFFFPENALPLGQWSTRPIGLLQAFIDTAASKDYMITPEMIRPMIKRRRKFDHKGSYGHALLIMGSRGKTGAAILAAKAALRAGAGLVSVHAPASSYPILQIAVPEAMTQIDPHEQWISSIPDLQAYRSVGIGCGMGTAPESQEALQQYLQSNPPPTVFDADALNILANQQELLSMIPNNSILTPHPGEFKRLFGESANDFERQEIQRNWAIQLKSYILLKGAHSCIACPDGRCFFNSSGNPGMATGGSGDVLTGMITALLAQRYAPFEALLLGTYLHGLAGDLAAHKLGQHALLAGDLVDHIGAAFLKMLSFRSGRNKTD